MSRATIARPAHVVGWVAALVALAWFASTSTGAEVDLRFAAWVRDVRAGALDGSFDGAFLGITEVFRPMFVAPATLIAALFLWRRLRAMALLVPLAFGASIAMTYVMKWLLDRDRPAGPLRLSELPALHDGAFPSAHVAGVTGTGMALIQVLAPMIRRGLATALKWAVVALVGVVALSRVWVGAHWLSDVAGGLAAGVVGLIIALLALRSAPVRRMMAGGRRF
ncbi:MAG TPA: phosphatase PAP2 family protein [Corynebacterium sp.]|uniref:phosphatase PAP2 family protein n=1 Tax=Corynebacterium sp. TaxID=1720 RepID=UPI001859B214|nr:phosphatase PAP2 family protein [Corynebacterium sp.]HHT32367.1 phosphatase PAP2 family protein [Corynebacterium sp.]